MYFWMEPQGARGPLGAGSGIAREAEESPMLLIDFFISLTTTITISSILYQYTCFATNSQQDVDANTTIVTMLTAKPNRSKNQALVVHQR